MIHVGANSPAAAAEDVVQEPSLHLKVRPDAVCASATRGVDVLKPKHLNASAGKLIKEHMQSEEAEARRAGRYE